MINLNSSSLIWSSINALEICEATVSNLELASILIFKCFSALIVVFLTTTLQNNEIALVATPLIPSPKAIGEATPVANNMAPAPSEQIVIPIKTLSTTLTYLATQKYFLLNASRLLISSSKNFCTSDITFNLCE